MSQKITKLDETVRDLLHEYPESRDSDYALYFYLIQKDDPLGKKIEMTLSDALQAMDQGKIPSIFSVARARRIVQELAAKSELTEYLCGNRKRKKELEGEVSEEIINYKKDNE
jgi:hypothetical protein